MVFSIAPHLSSQPLTSIIPVALLLLQLPAAAILLSRLIKGPSRIPPLEPDSPTLDFLGACTAVVPTLNEADRISPCLEGLSRQSYELREAIVVDSYSVDGTGDLVKAAAQKDPRFRLINDDPLPAGWVGRPWALHTGFFGKFPEVRVDFGDRCGYCAASGFDCEFAEDGGGWKLRFDFAVAAVYPQVSGGVVAATCFVNDFGLSLRADGDWPGCAGTGDGERSVFLV